MAISLANYVGVGSELASGGTVSLVSSNLRGLVITGATMKSPGDPEDDSELMKKYNAFNQGEAVSLTAAEAGVLFGDKSAEHRFANGYFGYTTPTNLSPQTLYFANYEGESPVAAAERVFGLNVDFGSFTFLSIPGESTASDADDLQDVIAVANTNSSRLGRKMYVVNFQKITGTKQERDEVVKVSEALYGAHKCCLIYGANEWSSFMPMAILAAQDIATQGIVPFMYNMFAGEEPTVFDDATYSTLSAANVNFLGRTQRNGQNFDFFQRGYATDGTDMTVSIVEDYLKEQITDSVLALFLNGVMPATTASANRVRNAINVVMNQAGVVGLVTTEVTLSTEDQQNIASDLAKLGAPTEVAGFVSRLTTYGYSSYVTILPKAPLGNVSGNKVEKSISFLVYYAYAGSIRYVSGVFKAV